jgi:hypothetical protein
VGIVGPHEVDRIALHSLRTHPGVGLDVFHDVADVEVAVGVRQGGGGEDFACGHGKNSFHGEPGILEAPAAGRGIPGLVGGDLLKDAPEKEAESACNL